MYDEYAPRVHGYVRAKGVPEPDEVTNDVFAQALTSLARFEGDESAFRSWLFTIAHRRVIDVYRRASGTRWRCPTTPSWTLGRCRARRRAR